MELIRREKGRIGRGIDRDGVEPGKLFESCGYGMRIRDDLVKIPELLAINPSKKRK